MQKATTPKRYYIDHGNAHDVEVRAVSCPWPKRVEHPTPATRPATHTAERLFSAGRLVRSGLLKKR